MKRLLTILIFLISIHVNATTYYINSNGGNDANDGLTTGTAWLTLTNIASHEVAGNVFNLAAGSLFNGSIYITTNSLTFQKYNTGANPIITGFTNVTAWNNLGSNIWESTGAVSTKAGCNMVTINGINTAQGRWPNTGYNTIGSATATSITDPALTTTWTKGVVVIRTVRENLDTAKILSQSSTTITFTAPVYPPTAGWGYFIEGDSLTLDTQNEWYYSPYTKKLRIYSTVSPTNVSIAALDTLFSAIYRNNITVDSIDFTGANENAMLVGSCNNFTLIGCNFTFCGGRGFYGQPYGGTSHSAIISGNTFNQINNTAINLCSEFDSANVHNNLIKNTGTIPGVGSYLAATTFSGKHSTISYNEIDTTGYVGIDFNGDTVSVNNNLVNYFCYIKDDGAGIYTGQPFKGRVIANNIVLNAIGAGLGTTSPTANRAYGIYCDDYSNNVTLKGNAVSNGGHGAIFLHANTGDSLINNTTFDAENSLLIVNYMDTCHDINYMNGNKFIAKSATQLVLGFTTFTSTNYGTWNNNYYARPIDDNLTINIDGTNYSLATWQTYSGRDAASNKSIKAITTVNDIRFDYNANAISNNVTIPWYGKTVDSYNYNGIIPLGSYDAKVTMNNGSVIGGISVLKLYNSKVCK